MPIFAQHLILALISSGTALGVALIARRVNGQMDALRRRVRELEDRQGR